MNADQLLHDYIELNKTPSGQRYYRRYMRLKLDVIAYQDAWLEAIFSGEVTEDKRLLEMIYFGGGIGLGADHNKHWHDFMQRVRERQGELSVTIKQWLQWLQKTHGW